MENEREMGEIEREREEKERECSFLFCVSIDMYMHKEIIASQGSFKEIFSLFFSFVLFFF